MAKLRKTLAEKDSPCVLALVELVKTQSKRTIAGWCIGYTEAEVLPIYEAAVPGDERPRAALHAARRWLAGGIKLPAAKQYILAAHAAAREAEGKPAAQAAARTAGQVTSVIHMPAHALGLPLYGSAALAYHSLGLEASPDAYAQAAAMACANMEAALRAVAVPDEPNPAKIKWKV